jgi:membrane fusion protein, multidrug efflux system
MTISLSPESTAPTSADTDTGVATLPERPQRRLRWWSALGIASVTLLFGAGYSSRQTQRAALAQEAARLSREPARVVVISPGLTQGKRSLLLPGTIQPLESAKIYSRANGYVKAWHADLGDPVEAGALLAELDTPEADREVEEARAALAQAEVSILQARATLVYSRSTLERYVSLTALGLSSQQELDERKAQAMVDAAGVDVAVTVRKARAAQLRRLEQVGSFSRVLAPFSGKVSARSVERGTLVSAGTGAALFEVVATDPVRIFVQVPQSLVQGVRSGLDARVDVSEFPGQPFAGKLSRSSGTLDPESRTMRVEVHVPNAESKLLPGMYASVRLELDASHRAFVLPATAVLQRKGGTFIAAVGDDGRIQLLPVEIERDSGAEVELRSGLSGLERVVRSPGPELVEGLLVQIAS